MPYSMSGGHLKDNKGHVYNKKPKSKKELQRQMMAIEASKARRRKKK